MSHCADEGIEYSGCGAEINENTPLLGGRDASIGVVGATLKSSCARRDEESALCGSLLADKQSPRDLSSGIAGVISILLLGVFIANLDGSLVLATSGTISSEFNDLGNAGWLVSSYTLAMCATQSLYGKLSDIYGRKGTILVSYGFFTVGCAICGLGQSLSSVVFGRLIAGIGGAGINCLVAIIIADMVPIREVAKWRSYVNIAATTGRSLGGPVGGFLADTIGWRWSFLIQCPPTLLALILVSHKLHIVINDSPCKQSHLSKLRRIDFLGSITLCICIVCGLLVLDLGGTRMPWTEPLLLILLGIAVAAGVCFILVEAYWAKEPVFPLRLLRNRDVLTSYVGLGCQSGAQMAMMLLVPIYFQITDHASVTAAGAHLMPSVMGNALGGLLTGHIIHRTGHYHPLLLLSAISSLTAYTLLFLRWHGHTTFLESLYIIPGGFGNGIALSAFFVSLTSGVETEEMAIASSGLYLSSNVGMLVGLSVADCIMRRGLDTGLRIALEGWHGGDGGMGRREIIRRAGSDVEFVRGLQGELGEVVRKVWVGSLGKTHVVSIVGALMALVAACCVREHRL